MNIKHIQYIVEIERVRSISQAAENLYIGQPNLSRILKEVEGDVGFPIFLRTTHGVRPTERGAVFLQHAHNILGEMESIQMMSPHRMVDDRLRIVIPRSAVSLQTVADYLKSVCELRNIYVEIRECHAKRALELLVGGNAEIGIIRFREGYEEYFCDVASTSKLTFRVISKYDDMIVIHHTHPLASCEQIKFEDLSQYIQIAHGDNYFMPQKFDEKPRSQIYTVDRQAQFTLLNTIPGTYMWSVPQTEEALRLNGLVQKKCAGYLKRYCEALIYNHQHSMNPSETEFLEKILVNSSL